MFLDALLSAVSSWSDDDIAAFLTGQRELVLRSRPKGSNVPRRKPGRSSPVDARDVRERLSQLDTREAGFAYLDKLNLSRDSLRRLASDLDLPTTRADTVDRLRDRIVEALIGYRLRSRALRGRDLSHGWPNDVAEAGAANPQQGKPRNSAIEDVQDEHD